MQNDYDIDSIGCDIRDIATLNVSRSRIDRVGMNVIYTRNNKMVVIYKINAKCECNCVVYARTTDQRGMKCLGSFYH